MRMKISFRARIGLPAKMPSRHSAYHQLSWWFWFIGNVPNFVKLKYKFAKNIIFNVWNISPKQRFVNCQITVCFLSVDAACGKVGFCDDPPSLKLWRTGVPDQARPTRRARQQATRPAGFCQAPMRDWISSVVCKKIVKKLVISKRWFKKVCSCLAPIRVLQCFCHEATPDKCPSGCLQSFVTIFWMILAISDLSLARDHQDWTKSNSFKIFFCWFFLSFYFPQPIAVSRLILRKFDLFTITFEMRIVCHFRISP